MQKDKKLTAKSLHEWLVNHKSLPTFPSVIQRLDEVLAAEDVSIEAVVAVLQSDVSVVARIMKTVNSAKYVMHEPAQSLADAVSRLGFATTRMLATAAAFMNLMSAPRNFSAREFWQAAFVSAVACREVVKMARSHQEVFDPSSAFTLGLARDIGIFLLDNCCAERYQEVVQQMQANPLSLIRIEQQVLGIDHAIASAVLLRSWHFPENWVMGVAGHYFPARLPLAQQPWADALLIAESLAFYLGFSNGICAGTPQVLPELTELRLRSLGLTAQDFKQLALRVQMLVDQEGWLALAEEFTH
jgi:HD-like signal output (HDOD) protein